MRELSFIWTCLAVAVTGGEVQTKSGHLQRRTYGKTLGPFFSTTHNQTRSSALLTLLLMVNPGVVVKPSFRTANPRLSALPRARRFRISRGHHRVMQSIQAEEEEEVPERREVAEVRPRVDSNQEASSEASSAEMLQLAKARMLVLQRATGLDRGIVASEDDVHSIDLAVRDLEDLSGARSANLEEEDKLDGRWRLVYSSAFATGTLGGSRAGPSSNGPVRLGKIIQRIRARDRRLDNIIEPVYIVGPSTRVDVELGHVLEFIGKDEIRITSDGATIRPKVAEWLPPLDVQAPTFPFFEEVRALLPQELRDQLQRIGSSTFNVSYLDDDVYITRGDRDELRIFVRD